MKEQYNISQENGKSGEERSEIEREGRREGKREEREGARDERGEMERIRIMKR